MKLKPHFVLNLLLPLLGAGLLAARTAEAADGLNAWAIVRGVMGQAEVSRGGGAYVPLKVSDALQAGDVVRTATGSAADIFLAETPGVVRLAESTVLGLEKFATTGGGFEIELDLRAGELLGKAGAVPAGSRFRVKVASGISAVTHGQFRFNSRGFVVLLEGKIIHVHVPASGEPKAHDLDGPPAVYFSPIEGLRSAPPQLVKEVSGQWRAKLKGK